MDIIQPDITSQVMDQGNAAPSLFNIIVPQPFSLAAQPKEHLEKIKDECMDHVKTWENRMTGFFTDYQIFADSWRVKSTKSTKKPTGLFNSKSGETHRASETLGTFWLRQMTATDQYFEAVAEGFDGNGQEVTPESLYASEIVLTRQLQISHYKQKLLRSLNSVGLFGTAIFEEPFVSVVSGNGMDKFEYTDFVFRSLLKTAFDTNVWDINMSDFIATIDFPSKHLLRRWSQTQGEYWDKEAIEKYLGENELGSGSSNRSTGVWGRVTESKQRAGYTEIDNNIFEMVSYHGKLNTENPVIAEYWEKEGVTGEDPNNYDFSVRILNGSPVVSFHMTQFGTWHSRFKVACFKDFEDESLGYGIGRIGRKGQREMDITKSRASDALMKAVYNMYLVGRYAGLKANQLNINPNGLIEIDDVDQVKPLPIDLNSIAQALAMQGLNQEDFRNTVGASSNLQAQITKASATESALAQTEAIRGASVHGEIIAETFLREHIETMHVNNIEYLDEPMWVVATGESKPGYYNRTNLPRSIGVQIKVVTDKDFRPERVTNLLKALELWSSIRNNFPPTVDAVPYLSKELFRAMGLNPRLLSRPMSMQDQLALQMQKAQNNNQTPHLGNEVEGEAASVGTPGADHIQQTPVGPVPTSPLGSQITQGM